MDFSRIAVPAFDLYGEPGPRPRPEPVHLEPLAARSARHGWDIRPHRHRALHQIFWIRRGRGVLLGEGAAPAFRAPALHLIPAGRVHGLRCDPASEGHILTLGDAFVAELDRLAGGALLPDAVVSLSPDGDDPLLAEMDDAFARLEAAFLRFGAGRPAALAGHVLLLLSLLRRGAEEADGAGGGVAGARAALVRRFRQQVERRYREHAGLDAYCRDLGVTRSTLTRACRAVTGRAPLALIQERLLAEARRLLRQGGRPVSGVAYGLGFEPAYFSRFFARHEGIPPALYRRRQGDGPPHADATPPQPSRR